ncbi:28S ribosomal protein S18a, mitochondrial [Orussus abietinus]|uniref:28S ribosomal protein S18a, mitochondrial n=1 Tax=Orussus abietinus TaxID=222816 RepID=UPI0006253798|nr:28S ribosomal protein S18a, mitochondrial [Orussus abietinus]
MGSVFRLAVSLGRNLVLSNSRRDISLSSVSRIKEIHVEKEDNTTIIEAVVKPQPKEHLLVKTDKKSCILCALDLDVKHTDVLILSQFLTSRGCMLPKRITGLCSVQQKRVTTLVAMAQKAGLMPNIAPKSSKKDPTTRYKWKKYNTYYDETTIRARYY